MIIGNFAGPTLSICPMALMAWSTTSPERVAPIVCALDQLTGFFRPLRGRNCLRDLIKRCGRLLNGSCLLLRPLGEAVRRFANLLRAGGDFLAVVADDLHGVRAICPWRR